MPKTLDLSELFPDYDVATGEVQCDVLYVTLYNHDDAWPVKFVMKIDRILNTLEKIRRSR